MFAPISSMPSSSSTPGLVELAREVQRGAAAHRRQQRVGPLAAQHGRDAFEVERLDVGAVGEAGVGHDRRRVRVDDDRAVAVLAQHLQRLAAGVVELAGLADHDRAGADQADRVDVGPPQATALQPPRPSRRRSAARRAGPGSPRDGTATSVRAARGGEPLDRAVVERHVRHARAVARRDREAVVLASSRARGRSRRSSTGWFAPRWPNGSLNVSRPVASASS